MGRRLNISAGREYASAAAGGGGRWRRRRWRAVKATGREPLGSSSEVKEASGRGGAAAELA